MTISIAIVAIVAMTGFYACIALVVRMVTQSTHRRTQLQADVQSKLIDRFGTAPELIDFLQSPAGRQFVSGFQNVSRDSVREKLLTGIRRGIIVTLLGIGALAIYGFDIRDNFGWIYPGCILLALGLGYFLSTFVSLKLSQSWGLMGDESRPPAA